MSEGIPGFRKCLCCCCLSKSASIKLCTWLFAFWYIYCAAVNVYNFKELDFSNIDKDTIITLGDLICYIVAIITLVLFAIGLQKEKKGLLSQFKIIYLIVVIYRIVSAVVECTDSYEEITSDKFLNDLNKNRTEGDMTYTKDDVKKMSYYIYFMFAAFELLNIYYYLTGLSYIKELNARIDDEDNIRDMESGKY